MSLSGEVLWDRSRTTIATIRAAYAHRRHHRPRTIISIVLKAIAKAIW